MALHIVALGALNAGSNFGSQGDKFSFFRYDLPAHQKFGTFPPDAEIPRSLCFQTIIKEREDGNYSTTSQ
jgi:hypothetical protein